MTDTPDTDIARDEDRRGPRDIHAYLAEFEDIPGTRVFTARRAREGYHMNQFAMSLMKADNRARFKADERAYMDAWPLTEEQKAALAARDYNRCLDLGGNVYFLAKLFSTDGVPFAQAVSTMTDMNFEDYTRMMVAGGRSPDGVRSLKAGAGATGAALDAADTERDMKEDR